MSEVGDRLRRLEIELEALQRIQTQEEFDEGARLHAIHNAPWVKGQYSHIEFPPYQFRAFPMAIYKVGFTEAYRTRVEADMIPAFGQNDIERKQAVLLAERAVARLVALVKSEGELRKYLATGEWFTSPQELEDEAASQQKAIETAAAHRAYEDLNMGEGARRELEKFDDEAEDFVAEVPQQRRAGKRRTVNTDTAIKAAAAAGGSQHGKEGKGSSAKQGSGGAGGHKAAPARGRRG